VDLNHRVQSVSRKVDDKGPGVIRGLLIGSRGDAGVHRNHSDVRSVHRPDSPFFTKVRCALGFRHLQFSALDTLEFPFVVYFPRTDPLAIRRDRGLLSSVRERDGLAVAEVERKASGVIHADPQLAANLASRPLAKYSGAVAVTLFNRLSKFAFDLAVDADDGGVCIPR